MSPPPAVARIHFRHGLEITSVKPDYPHRKSGAAHEPTKVRRAIARRDGFHCALSRRISSSGRTTLGPGTAPMWAEMITL